MVTTSSRLLPLSQTLRGALLALPIAAAALPLHAEPDGALLAAGCTGCHGAGGVSQGAIPSLAGADPQAVATAMAAFRSGERPGTVMTRLSKGYDEAQVRAIAAWFAAQKAAQ